MSIKFTEISRRTSVRIELTTYLFYTNVERNQEMLQKPIYLLDDSVSVEIYFERNDCDLADNICVKIIESCPEDEKILKHDESHIYLTPEQARRLVMALQDALEKSLKAHENSVP